MTEAYADFFGPHAHQAEQYVDILLGRGVEWGVIGPREGERIWQRHVLNCVAGVSLLRRNTRVVDVGSGGGLPGLPVALLRPDLQVTLLEPLERRCNFLALAVSELGLADQVRVVRGRAEDHGERYDAVLSRAVAPLTRLLGWCAPLRAPGGLVVALKGSSAADEVRSAKAALRQAGLVAHVHEFPVPVVGEPTWVVEAGDA